MLDTVPASISYRYAHKADIKPSAQVKKVLSFGDTEINHEEARKELDEQFASIAKQDALKWNFDFVKEQPLGGKYKWELHTVEQPILDSEERNLLEDNLRRGDNPDDTNSDSESSLTDSDSDNSSSSTHSPVSITYSPSTQTRLTGM